MSFVFCTTLTFAQENNVYQVKYDVLKMLSQNKKINNAFHATTIHTVKKTTKTIKVKNKEFAVLKNKIAVLNEEKNKAKETFHSLLKEYENKKIIADNVKQFLQSTQPFDTKKHLLKSSQILANKYNINELLYADKTINTKNKSKFLIYSLNAVDLKLHLRKVLPNLESKIPQKPTLNFDDTKLTQLENKLKNTQPFLFKEIPGKNIETKKMLTNGEVTDHSLLAGEFKKVTTCLVITKNYKNILSKNQVIEPQTLEQFDLNINDLKYKELTLIQNTKNNHHYVVEDSFLKDFGYKIN